MKAPVFRLCLSVLAALCLAGCNRPSEPESPALQAEIEATAAQVTPAPSPLPQNPPALAQPEVSATPTPESGSALPVIEAQGSDPQAETVPEPPVAVETQLQAQRETLDELKSGQAELRTLIEGLRLDLQQLAVHRSADKPTEQSTGKPKPSRTAAKHRRAHAGAPPFRVEGISTWGNERRVVVRLPDGQRRDLSEGDSIGGWVVQGAEGSRAHFRDPSGQGKSLDASWQ